jgi:hypothetical protein
MKGVSGVEMLCGSAGRFTEDCVRIPSGSKNCSETFDTIEDDEQLLNVLKRNQPSTQQQQEEGEETNVLSAGYGGSGGVGALNPGASGRDRPELTATLNAWESGVAGTNNSSSNVAGTVNNNDSDLVEGTIDPESPKKDWPAGNLFPPESVAIAIETDSSSAAVRTVASKAFALATLCIPAVGFLFGM